MDETAKAEKETVSSRLDSLLEILDATGEVIDNYDRHLYGAPIEAPISGVRSPDIDARLDCAVAQAKMNLSHLSDIWSRL